MYYLINLPHERTPVNFLHEVHRLLVEEPSSGYTLPEADAYARRLAEEAEGWLAHARARSRMKEPTLISKAIHSLAFSLRHRAHDFAVPSKLSGTSKHQPALWQLTRQRVGFGAVLDVEEVNEEKKVLLVVSYEGETLGEVQSKHVSWLRPLLRFGAGVYLTRVTGHEESFMLGCNVALGRVGSAVAALNHALGSDSGGDGYGGDGASQEALRGAQLRVPSVPEAWGDGATESAHVTGPAEILFWRDEEGILRMNVPHVIKHSPTGPEVGYQGSGPADASLSVLSAVTSREEAERFYQRYKQDVISRLPFNGGVISRASVEEWLAARRAE